VKQAQVIWSSEALVDLEIIHDFLAEKSHLAAQRTIENLLDRTKQLEVFPESGAIQESIMNKRKEYRYLVEGNYKIVYSYQSKDQVVYIEIIFDTRYNPEKLKT
jgi:plasmid stabilization system protein ParE